MRSMTPSASESTKCRSRRKRCSRHCAARRKASPPATVPTAFPRSPGPNPRACRPRGKAATERPWLTTCLDATGPPSKVTHAPPTVVYVSTAAHTAGRSGDEGRCGARWHVRGRRNRSLPEHEAPPSGAADGHLTDGDSGAPKCRRRDGWNLCDADRAFEPPKRPTFRDCNRGMLDALAARKLCQRHTGSNRPAVDTAELRNRHQ